jgi:predicted DNA-binding transcriptional regulator AlpA
MRMTHHKSAAQVEPAQKAANMVAEGRAIRLLSKPEICDKVGRTFPTIWSWMRAGKFPLPRDLGGKPAWVEAEVDAWIASLPVRQYKAPEAAEAAA